MHAVISRLASLIFFCRLYSISRHIHLLWLQPDLVLLPRLAWQYLCLQELEQMGCRFTSHIWVNPPDSSTIASSISSSRDVEGPWDGSNQFRDAFPCPFADDNFEAVQGKLIDEQGNVGSFCTPCMSSNQRIGCSWPSNPRLDGGRSKLTLQGQYIFSDRPALGWTVEVRHSPVLEAKWILHTRHLLFAHK